MNESEIQARGLLRVGALPGVRMFRNTVGEGWTGQQVKSTDKSLVILRNAARVTFGLHPGSPDAVGWRSIVITPSMAGCRIAQIIGGEFKTATGRTSPDQDKFLGAMREAGALVGVWRDPESVYSAVIKPFA